GLPRWAAAAPRPGEAQSPVPVPVPVSRRVTRKDPPDLRDRLYQPPPVVLRDAWPPEEQVRAHFKDYRALVLNQGQDFSCTGYGLACVINFARWAKAGFPADLPSVSARMLYNYARRYDEYEGEDYDGSSCRGALKGWFNHGVCLEPEWPDHEPPVFDYARRALQTTLGVYYRIDIKAITDLQAAILQANAIYVSAFTHDGWTALDQDKPSRRTPSHDGLPVIAFDGRPSRVDGHAFALVGFNSRGFIVQNSWGPGFGAGGFAILGYADWLANGMDAWVASLGVPGVVHGRLADGRGAGPARAGAAPAHWWDEGRAYEHSIVVGNDGRVRRYLTQDELNRSLLYQACTLPDQFFRTDPLAAAPGARKKLVVYAHGGLNGEQEAMARARALGRYFTGNGCYPLFLVWKTGLLESLGFALEDFLRRTPQRVGVISDFTDALIEKTIARGPGRMVWSEMKENARFAATSNRACDALALALQGLAATWGEQLEIHLVGHSAGAIVLGHLLEVMAPRGLAERIAGVHLYAPACTVQFANQYYAPHAGAMRSLRLHLLSDQQERDDSVAAIYRKSLLYLVSNALEPDLRTPLLGMENVLKPDYRGWDGSSTTTEALSRWRQAAAEARLEERTVVVHGPHVPIWMQQPNAVGRSIRATHGSFDNNVEVVASTLQQITGRPELAVPVDDLRGF
ncbi:MAG TPA: C1 family peptidase, partial [Ramlibacter sp.]|nr:C1 family peptidase [Ramlibacter sp.]